MTCDVATNFCYSEGGGISASHCDEDDQALGAR
jgi:hypothetical protein